MAEPETPELAQAAVDGGADIIELGFPFSDPLADGPVIRRAGERALARGMRTRACLDVPRADARARPRHAADPDDVLVAPRGVRLGALRRRRAAAGGDEHDRRRPAGGRAARSCGACSSSRRPRPTSASRSRASRPTAGSISSRSTGTTGARGEVSPALAGLVERARRLVDVPLYAGFGISTPEHARAAAELADGIVVGSRALSGRGGRAGRAARSTSRRCARRSTRSPDCDGC